MCLLGGHAECSLSQGSGSIGMSCRPQCKLFIEDMLCCEAGALTNKQYASAYLQCTHPVNFYSQCLNVTGPTNVTVFNSFSSSSVWAVNHHVQADFAASDFTGNVTLDVEGPR